MDTTKSCKVTILGREYSLVSNEDHELIVRSAQLVDAAMQEIAHKAAGLDEAKVAVLAALRIASKTLSLEQEQEHKDQYYKQLADYIDHVIADDSSPTT